ncbi:MAG: sulfatase [Anaerolineaceae bacterium]|nr:sulfatase [Anaerolineaceae bacterium]
MKAIMVMFDTLNRHMLPPYGCDWTHAPNFARLAQRSVTFDRSCVGSMPCMPARRELHTGRYNFLHRSWGPLEPFDDSMPELLKDKGVYTHLVTDHYHYFEDGGATYHQRYNSWQFARGQEGDPWMGQVAEPDIPETMPNTRVYRPMWRQDWVNRGFMKEEDRQPQAKTFAMAGDFLRRNHQDDNWFLQIETFDPHEPFFTQEHYKALYPHRYEGPHFDWPDYGVVQESPEEVHHLRMEYAALLSMCDHYMGKIIDLMDELDLWQDTMLIVNTDHGFMLGEHDWWGKMVMPFYEEVAHTPLFIWDPRCARKGERNAALVQTIDLPATLLEYFGVELPAAMQGRPLRDTLATDAPVHEAVMFGLHGAHVNLTDGRYVYMRGPASEDNAPLYNYTLMPTHMRERFPPSELQDTALAPAFEFSKGCALLKIPSQPKHMSEPHGFATTLWDVEADPLQTQPLQDAALEARLADQMRALMEENEAPAEQYERLGL